MFERALNPRDFIVAEDLANYTGTDDSINNYASHYELALAIFPSKTEISTASVCIKL